MEDILYCKDMYEPLQNGGEKPTGKSDAEWSILNRKAVAGIRQWVDESVFHHVAQETNAYSMWKKLESMYERKTAQNKASFIRRLVNTKYRDGRSVSEHLSDFQGMVNQLTNMKMVLDDELQALLLLSSLPDSWDTLVVSLSNSAPQGVLSLSTVKDSMFNEEARRKEQGISTESEALVADNRGSSRKFHNRGKAKDRSRGKFSPKKSIKCYHCGQKGHMRNECRKLKEEHAEKGGTRDTAATTSYGDEVIIICEDGLVNMTSQDTCWVVDSGASFHVTSRKEFFTSYNTGNFGNVRMGNDKLSKIMGRGDISLETNTGRCLVLKDVRHVPDMRLNLISTGLLDDEGCTNIFGDGKWKLRRGPEILARGKKENTLNMTYAKVCSGYAVTLGEDSPVELWHKRLGHISEKGLTILAKREVLSGVNVKDMHLKACTDCLAGKQHRASFHRSPAPRKSNVLDVVHSDVCGPMTTSTHGGARYFVTFIDDHSRKVWAYALRTKDKVLEVFKQFHAGVERETGRTLKCIRTDNGGEYMGAFRHYCKSNGIRHERSVPKTPQHNGVAERMNRTIVERIRTMLSHAKLPKSFWGEALMTAVDVINLSPSAPLNGDVPNKFWTGKDVSYNHLKVFGCRAFVHIPKDERSKIDSKSKECIFLGYGNEEYGYRLWDPVKKKIVRSRDVVFFEDQNIEDTQKPKQPREYPMSTDKDSPPAKQDGREAGDAANDQMIDGPVDDAANDEEEAPTLRRSTRERRTSKRYPPDEFVTLTEGGEPETYEEALTDDHKGEWLEAMQEEMQSLHENQTYELVELPKGKRALRNKWVYRLKTEENSSRPRFKARLVVKGFNQKKGIDFEEIFSPVVKMTSIRVVLGLAASLKLEIEQLDVKTAFLHGDLEEEIYMEHPEGFKVKSQEGLVCKLKKSLYGLKQAPRQWYKKFDSFMIEQGYRRMTSDYCVFLKNFSGGDIIILLLYVDDMLIVGQDGDKISKLKQELSKSFSMKDLGPAKQIFGMNIIRDRENRKLWLSQEKYIEKILKRFNMEKANPVATPLASHFKLSSKQSPASEKEEEEMAKVPYASAVGSLMYAMVCKRPDITHAVGVVSRYLSNPGKEHWNAVKWILKYLKGTSKMGLCFGTGEPELIGYTDADMAGDVDSRKSTSGYLITFSGGAVSWKSKLQKCVALSTTEAEFIAATEACKEILWMKKFLQELGHKQQKYVLHCDSQSAIHLSKNSSFHSKSKHIDVRYHWIRDVLEAKQLQLEKIHTDENSSDMMTKSLPKEKFEFCRRASGMAHPSN